VRGDRTVGVDSREDIGQHAIEVGQNLVVPEAQDDVAHRFEYGCAVGIAGSRLRQAMLAAIEFNHDVMLETGEVDNEAPDRHLPLELQLVLLPAAQRRPKPALCVR
jgi:hypothetical protein